MTEKLITLRCTLIDKDGRKHGPLLSATEKLPEIGQRATVEFYGRGPIDLIFTKIAPTSVLDRVYDAEAVQAS